MDRRLRRAPSGIDRTDEWYVCGIAPAARQEGNVLETSIPLAGPACPWWTYDLRGLSCTVSGRAEAEGALLTRAVVGSSCVARDDVGPVGVET